MLTVNLKTGEKLVFMDFYPCKAKDLCKKLGGLITAVDAYTAKHKAKNKTATILKENSNNKELNR